MKKDVSLLFLFLPPTDQHAIATDECGCCVLLSQLHTVEIQEVSDDLVVLPQDIEAVYERAMALTADEVTEILELAWTEHHDDVRGYFPYRPVAQNRSLFELTGLPLVLVALLLLAAKLPLCRASQVGVFPLRNRIHSRELRRAVSGLLSTHTLALPLIKSYFRRLEEMKIEAALIRFSSPYPEVRSTPVVSRSLEFAPLRLFFFPHRSDPLSSATTTPRCTRRPSEYGSSVPCGVGLAPSSTSLYLNPLFDV
jgi:hypothetical protein